jgi:hypothetical protein
MRIFLVLAGLLAGCQPQPRSADYFGAHPTEAARVIADCRTGRHRGEECRTAQAGLAAADADRRLKLFRKSFD